MRRRSTIQDDNSSLPAAMDTLTHRAAYAIDPHVETDIGIALGASPAFLSAFHCNACLGFFCRILLQDSPATESSLDEDTVGPKLARAETGSGRNRLLFMTLTPRWQVSEALRRACSHSGGTTSCPQARSNDVCTDRSCSDEKSDGFSPRMICAMSAASPT